MSRNRKNRSQPDEDDAVIIKTVRIPLATWEKFERFNSNLKEIEELVSDIRSNWKYHLEYLSDEYHCYDKEEFKEFEETLRKLPRQIKYVSSGYYPPMEMSDDDLEYYDDLALAERCSRHHNYKKSKKYNVYPQPNGTHKSYHPSKIMHVRVIIEDVSDGTL